MEHLIIHGFNVLIGGASGDCLIEKAKGSNSRDTVPLMINLTVDNNYLL
jgi:hypothetical protein